MRPRPYLLADDEIDLLIDALARAASRHEAEARYNPPNAGPHDRKATAMRKLQRKFIMAKAETAAV